MAGSRLEKIGTIYTRTSGLIKSKALNWEDRPIWYDLYEAFPPKEEPKFDRPAPNIALRKIFYPEDKIRAQFHKHNKQLGAGNLSDTRNKSLTQRFIQHYHIIEQQYAGKADPDQIYREAVQLLQKDREARKSEFDDQPSLSTAFKEARTESAPQIRIKDIFKE